MKYPCCLGIEWFDNPVVNPLAFSPGRYYSRSTKVSKVARDLRLVRFQYFYQKADADLIISNEIDEAQTGRISKGLEE